jgi:hypothetical protein
MWDARRVHDVLQLRKLLQDVAQQSLRLAEDADSTSAHAVRSLRGTGTDVYLRASYASARKNAREILATLKRAGKLLERVFKGRV